MFSFFLLIKSVITLLLLRSSLGVVVGVICVDDIHPTLLFLRAFLSPKESNWKKKHSKTSRALII